MVRSHRGAEGHALVVARLSDTASAIYVYDDLCQAEKVDGLHIDGVLVVQCDEGGNLRVRQVIEHSTKNGLKWSIVAGAIATICLPATGAAGPGVRPGLGGAARQARTAQGRDEIDDELSSVMMPGTSGVVCLAGVDALNDVADVMPWAQEIRMIPLDSQTADDLNAAAAWAASGTHREFDSALPEEPWPDGEEPPVDPPVRS